MTAQALAIVMRSGAILLVGAAYYRHFVAAPRAVDGNRSGVAGWIVAATTAVIAASLAGAVATAVDLYAGWESEFLARYAFESREGRASLGRVALAAALAWAAWSAGSARRAASAVLGSAMVASLAVTSHASGAAGPVDVPLDALHGAAAAAWMGALFGVAWIEPCASREDREWWLAAVARVSATAGACVFVLAGTGVYAALQRIWGPPALLRTTYGHLLTAKLLLLALAIGVAVINRWHWLPFVRAGSGLGPLRSGLRAESMLVLAALCVAGALATEPPPEPARRVVRLVAVEPPPQPWSIEARAVAGPDGAVQVSLLVVDDAGAPAAEATSVRVHLDQAGRGALVAVNAVRIGPGRYQAVLAERFSADWTLEVVVPGGRARFQPLTR
jgi:putative copper export protein